MAEGQMWIDRIEKAYEGQNPEEELLSKILSLIPGMDARQDAFRATQLGPMSTLLGMNAYKQQNTTAPENPNIDLLIRLLGEQKKEVAQKSIRKKIKETQKLIDKQQKDSKAWDKQYKVRKRALKKRGKRLSYPMSE